MTIKKLVSFVNSASTFYLNPYRYKITIEDVKLKRKEATYFVQLAQDSGELSRIFKWSGRNQTTCKQSELYAALYI